MSDPITFPIVCGTKTELMTLTRPLRRTIIRATKLGWGARDIHRVGAQRGLIVGAESSGWRVPEDEMQRIEEVAKHG